MSTQNTTIQISGLQVLLVLPVIIILFVIRIISMNDMTNNEDLMREIEFILTSEYFPEDVDRLKKLYETGGGSAEFDRELQSAVSTRLSVISVKASYPLFKLSNREKDVIVKIEYSVDDRSGVRSQGIRYFKFRYTPNTNRWRNPSERNAVSYYLNFL